MSASSSDSSSWDEVHSCVKNVLSNYEKSDTQRRYEELMRLTIAECENLLKGATGTANKKQNTIKGMVTGRIKKHDSLEKKLEDMELDDSKDPNKFGWLWGKLTELHNDSNKVHEELYWLGTMLKDFDNAPDQVPNLSDWVSQGRDIYEHPEMGDLAGVRIALYFPDDIVTIVERIMERFNVKHVFGTVTGGRNVSKRRNLDIYKHLEGQWVDPDDDHWENHGYKSWQMVVEWKEPPKKDLQSLRVEIQVGTVVTQAWAEVQHNVIYKNPDEILRTPTMKRMIDAINGLAVTTDLMLKELQQSLKDAMAKAEEQAREPFENGTQFLEWFHEKYTNKMKRSHAPRWVCNEDLAKRLISTARFSASQRGGAAPCPSEFKRLIEEYQLLKIGPETYQVDISERLIQAMGIGELVTVGQKLDDEFRALGERDKEKNEIARSLEPFRDGGDFEYWWVQTYVIYMPQEEVKRWSFDRDLAEVMVDQVRTFSNERLASIPDLPKTPKPCRSVFKKLIEEHGLLHTKETERQDISRLLARAMGVEELVNRAVAHRKKLLSGE